MLSAKPWQPDRVALFLIRLFASMFLGMVLVSVLHFVPGLRADKTQFLSLLVNIASFHGVALVLMHLLLRAHGLSWSQAFGFQSPRLPRALLLAFLVACAILPVALSLAELSAKCMSWLHLKPSVQDPVQMLQTAGSLPMKLLIGFLAVVAAPLVEELVFRGLIYPTVKQRGFPRLALWGTSLLFAGIHFNLAVLLPLTFLAVVWTLLYETTDNLLAPIFAHSIFNLANFFWVVTQPMAPGTGTPP